MAESTLDPTRVTQAMEDYLKAVYRIREVGEVATTQLIADELGVTGPSVTNMVKRLHDMHLLDYTRYHGVELTETGRKVALETIRHHRLLELYLAEALGFGWDQVHDEAEKLEHHVSADLEEKMDIMLGFPTRDPHGDPIPSRDGVIENGPLMALKDAPVGVTLTVGRVSDRSSEQLRYLGAMGLYPGSEVVVLQRMPFDDLVEIAVGSNAHVLGRQLVEAVQVLRVDESD